MSKELTATKQEPTQTAAADKDAPEQSNEVKTFTQEQVNKLIDERVKREGIQEDRDKARKYDELVEEVGDIDEFKKSLGAAKERTTLLEQREQVRCWKDEVAKEHGGITPAYAGNTFANGQARRVG